MEITVIVGKNVRNIRKQQRLSQDELAEMAGLARSHVSAIENGRKNTGIVTLAYIAGALNVRFTDLFVGYKQRFLLTFAADSLLLSQRLFHYSPK